MGIIIKLRIVSEEEQFNGTVEMHVHVAERNDFRYWVTSSTNDLKIKNANLWSIRGFVDELVHTRGRLADAQIDFEKWGKTLSSSKEAENGITASTNEVAKLMKFLKKGSKHHLFAVALMRKTTPSGLCYGSKRRL